MTGCVATDVGREDRVGVGHAAQDRGRVRGRVRVQGHDVVDVGVQRLEPVHPVRQAHRGFGAAAVGEAVVPRRPRGPPAGQQAGVGVQPGVVARVVPGPEQLLLAGARVGEHPEGLVGVGGDDDVVEAVGGAAGRAHVDAPRVARDRHHGVAGADPVAVGRGQRRDVARRPAHDGAPGVVGGDAEQAVVVEEGQQGPQREVQDGAGARRPDRRRHRGEVVVGELVGEPEGVGEPTDRGRAGPGVVDQLAPRRLKRRMSATKRR